MWTDKFLQMKVGMSVLHSQLLLAGAMRERGYTLITGTQEGTEWFGTSDAMFEWTFPYDDVPKLFEIITSN